MKGRRGIKECELTKRIGGRKNQKGWRKKEDKESKKKVCRRNEEGRKNGRKRIGMEGRKFYIDFGYIC